MGRTGAVAGLVTAVQPGGGVHPLPPVMVQTELGSVVFELDAASAPVTVPAICA